MSNPSPLELTPNQREIMKLRHAMKGATGGHRPDYPKLGHWSETWSDTDHNDLCQVTFAVVKWLTPNKSHVRMISCVLPNGRELVER